MLVAENDEGVEINLRVLDGVMEQVFRNSNYLLVIVPTFVMPYSITLNPRITPGCTTQRLA